MAVLNPYNYAKPKGQVIINKKQTQMRADLQNRGNNQGNKPEQYLEQKVLSASPEELTLLLYEGTVKFVKQAIMFNEEGLIEKTSNAILRTQAIFDELRATLNTDYEISTNFDSLYEYINRRLVEANISKDNVILEEVLELCVEFRDTWKEAMAVSKKE